MIQQFVTITVISLLLAFSNASVPTGCVEIRSNHNSQYLAVSDKQHTSHRQHTRTTSYPHLWTIKQEGDHFLIVDRKTPNQLYAGAYTYDRDRRYVFTWTQGNPIAEAPWEITPIENGKYLIRSKHLKEYMYAADFPSKGHVFTWRVKEHNARDDEQFHWYILTC